MSMATRIGSPIGGEFVKAHGKKGTYVTTHGGVGLAYDIGEPGEPDVVHSGGNGYFYPVPDLQSFVADGGAGYRAKLRGLALPPAYQV
jgi:hypothetical protein